jgi:Ion channel
MPPPRGRGGIEGIEEKTQPEIQPAGAAPAPRGRFGALLVVLIASYVMSALSRGRVIDALQIVLFAGAALLALRNSDAPRRVVHLALVALLGGTVIMVVLSASLTAGDEGTGIANLWTGLILLFAVGVIVRRVLSLGTVTIQSIYGAISAYLIIGLMFAAFYAAIDHLTGHAFFEPGRGDNTQTFQYFSFTTLTTLGYGDFVAVQNGGRAIAVLEALTGQIFLATLVARLVAAYRAPGGGN